MKLFLRNAATSSVLSVEHVAAADSPQPRELDAGGLGLSSGDLQGRRDGKFADSPTA